MNDLEKNLPTEPAPEKSTSPTPLLATGDEAELAELIRSVEADRKRNESQCPAKPIREVVKNSVQRIPPSRPRLTDEELAEREREREQSAKRREINERLAALATSRGERYAGCTLDNYAATTPDQKAALATLSEFSDSLADAIKRDGQGGLILFGPRGTGKDHLLFSLMRQAIQSELTVKWVNGMDLLGDIRDRIETGESESKLIRLLTNPDVLAISDPLPPFGSLSEFQATMLFRVIDARYSRRKPLWVTVNVASRAEFDERMGPQLVDRIIDGAMVVNCNWSSYRGAKKKP